MDPDVTCVLVLLVVMSIGMISYYLNISRLSQNSYLSGLIVAMFVNGWDLEDKIMIRYLALLVQFFIVAILIKTNYENKLK